MLILQLLILIYDYLFGNEIDYYNRKCYNFVTNKVIKTGRSIVMKILYKNSAAKKELLLRAQEEMEISRCSQNKTNIN